MSTKWYPQPIQVKFWSMGKELYSDGLAYTDSIIDLHDGSVKKIDNLFKEAQEKVDIIPIIEYSSWTPLK